MSVKSKLLAGAAALAMVSGSGVALTAGTAMAGTPSCGPNCLNLFQARYGVNGNLNGQFAPQFVTDVYKQGQHVGQPVIQFRASNSDPAEDWTISNQGHVSEFLAAGLVSPSLALHYGCVNGGALVNCPPVIDQQTGLQVFVNTGTAAAPKFAPVNPDLFAFEMEYAPFGADSGLCMGVAATATQNEGVTLQPCGVSSKSIWVIDILPIVNPVKTTVNGVAAEVVGAPSANPTIDNAAPDIQGQFGVPLINGSDTNFSHPFVLTYNGEPTAFPRAQTFVSNLTGFSNGLITGTSSLATISDAQQWIYFQGILP
jgi:hypothetical protein